MPYVPFEYPTEPGPLAIEYAAEMKAAYIDTVQAVDSPTMPGDNQYSLPNLPFFDPMWWELQFAVHNKWALGGSIPEFVKRLIRAVTHCQCLREHCDGCAQPRQFTYGAQYASRKWLQDPNAAPLSCPSTYAELVQIREDRRTAAERAAKEAQASKDVGVSMVDMEDY